jgi:two-component system, cell cycle sensor histidine kinase and response regulator CckA
MISTKLGYKILMIEDDEDDVLIIREMLDESKEAIFILENSEQLQEGLEILATESYNIILLDLNLPDSSGLDTLKNFLDKVPDIPVIVMTGLNDANTGIDAVKMGAQDYLVKGSVTSNLLTRSIRYAIERYSLITAQNQADEALRDSVQQWQTTFNAMNDAICLIDADGKISRANNAMSTLVKKPISEILDSNCWELVHCTTYRPDDCPVIKMLKTRNRESTVLPMDDKWFMVNVDPIWDDGGNVTGAVHIMTDITEQIRIEEDLRKSEEAYRGLFNSTRESIITTSFDGKILSANPASAKLLGFESSMELIGFDFANLYINPEHREIFLAELSKEGYLEDYELTLIKKDGTLIHTLLSSTASRNEQGNILKIETFIRDITERKLIENELKRTNRALNMLSECNQLLVRVTEEDELLHEICQIIVKYGGYNMAWISYINQNESNLETKTGYGDGYTEIVNIIQSESHDIIDSVIKRGELCYIKDVQSNPNIEISNYGCTSVVVLPLFEDKKAFGILFICLTESRSPDIRELNLLLELANDLSYGIMSIRAFVQRKRDEDALKERDETLIQQHNTLHQLIDNIPDQIFIKDLESRFVIANMDTIRGLGLSSTDDIIGKSDFDYEPPKYAQQHYEEEQEIIRTGVGFVNKEYSYFDLSGAKRWFSSTKIPLRDANGTIIGLVGSNREITNVKQAEEETHRIEKIYRNAIEATGAVPYIANFDTRKYEFMGENIKLLTGYSAEEFTIQTWTSILLETESPSGKYVDLTRDEAIIKAIDESKSNIERTAKFWLDFHIKTTSGEEKWLFDSSMQTRDDQGRTVRSLGIIHDVTEQKRAEIALRESEEKYRSLVENLNDVIFTVDSEGYVTYFNSIITKLFGYTIDELIDRKFDSFVFPDDLPGLLAELESTLAGNLSPYEFRVLDKKGKIHHVRTSSQPIYEGKQVIGLSGILTDITSQRQLEEQLRQSHKMEAVGMLAGGVAHDFNNQLQVIIGYSEFILTQLDSLSPLRQSIEEIAKAGEQAAALTRQLLAFSRRQMLQKQVISVNDLVYNMSKMLKRLIGEDIELINALEPDLWQVKADPGQIEQIIMNLSVNARDAMPDGGKLIIKTENIIIDEAQSLIMPESQPGEYIRVSVSDTGTGMSKEIMEHIFEPFFSTKDNKGTGLGLSVVYGIAKQHEGLINVYSETGQGSVFKLYLPAIQIQPEEETEEESSLIIFGNKERILLVEDEQMVLEFVSKILQDSNYVVFEASSVKGAMEIFIRERGDFALVLSDVVLPDASGVDLVESLHNINSDLRILLSSGYTDQKSQWQNIQDRGYNFIQKPYSIINLLKVIGEIIKS